MGALSVLPDSYYQKWKMFLRPYYYDEAEEREFISAVDSLHDFISVAETYKFKESDDFVLDCALRTEFRGYMLSSVIYRLYNYLTCFINLSSALKKLDHTAAPFVIGELMDEIFKLQQENENLKKEIEKNGKTN